MARNVNQFDQDALSRALNATQQQLSMEQRVTQHVLGQILASPAARSIVQNGVIIVRLLDELQSLLQASIQMDMVRAALAKLEQEERWEGVTAKLASTMKELGGAAELEPQQPEPAAETTETTASITPSETTRIFGPDSEIVEGATP